MFILVFDFSLLKYIIVLRSFPRFRHFSNLGSDLILFFIFFFNTVEIRKADLKWKNRIQSDQDNPNGNKLQEKTSPSCL